MPAKKKIETTKPSRSDAPTCSVAFRCTVKGFDEPGIYMAATRDKARFLCKSAANDAGFVAVKFGDIRAKRAPEFDRLAGQVRHGQSEQYARMLLGKISSQNAGLCDGDGA